MFLIIGVTGTHLAKRALEKTENRTVRMKEQLTCAQLTFWLDQEYPDPNDCAVIMMNS